VQAIPAKAQAEEQGVTAAPDSDSPARGSSERGKPAVTQQLPKVAVATVNAEAQATPETAEAAVQASAPSAAPEVLSPAGVEILSPDASPTNHMQVLDVQVEQVQLPDSALGHKQFARGKALSKIHRMSVGNRPVGSADLGEHTMTTFGNNVISAEHARVGDGRQPGSAPRHG